jgi:hypothetical protein
LVAACRTNIGECWEESISKKFRQILDVKSKILSSNVRTNFTGGELTDEELLETNKGKIIEESGMLPAKEDKPKETKKKHQ